MREKLCFVQFLHPGGEHGWDEPGMKRWNRDPAHRRKFLRGPGRLVDKEGNVRDEEIVFWGEWEPDSTVTKIDQRVREGPGFVHVPFLPSPGPDGWRQNTDPFVFGEAFHYYGCLQHTINGPTQLRFLAQGSVVLFGSCLDRSKFVLDTLLVVDTFQDDSESQHRKTRETVSATYAAATIDSWYSSGNPDGNSYRLYSGATVRDAVNGIYSFFPCRSARDAPNGFARPTITLPEVITPTMTQSKRLNPQPSTDQVAKLWHQVVAQVRAQGLDLGVHAELPPTRQAQRLHRKSKPQGAC